MVDLEMNDISRKYKEERLICKREIIEIGAAMLDETFEIVDQIRIYVKPQYNTITHDITELTGITNDMVKDAECFEQAMDSFFDWCGGRDGITIYSWSDSDVKQLRKECELKQYHEEEMKPLFKNWVDFQKEFGKLLGIEKKIALKYALGAINRDFDGHAHDAMDDAVNTAYILQLSQHKEEFNRIMQPIIEIFKPKEELTFSLGSLMAGLLDSLPEE
jgi:inhibitor of KinA sporulation pathway (predicted exonuclease)